MDALQSGGLCPAERAAGESLIDLETSLGPNRVIGDYRIESELGRGAFGTVYQAKDQMLERTVALKVLRSDDDVPMDSLLSEARAAAALNHPNVCSVHTIDTSKGAGMIVMEFVDGETLTSRLKREAVSPEQSVNWLRQVAAGMTAAHEAGVVHGDLKPGNLMVTSDEAIKIMDFGLARRVTNSDWQAETLPSSPSQSPGLSGTPGYMAPEMTRGERSSTASDVFSLGLIAYEMVTRRPAISGDNLLNALSRIQQLDAEQLTSELPEPLRSVARRALESDPDGRITMSEIASELAE